MWSRSKHLRLLLLLLFGNQLCGWGDLGWVAILSFLGVKVQRWEKLAKGINLKRKNEGKN